MGEEPGDGLEIGFLVELGWASLIIALGGKGQFALLLFSRMLKFLFLSGPVMYLKHMGTPATICPKSHIASTFLTMCHFDGVQREGEGEVKMAPWQLRPGAASHPHRGTAEEVSVPQGAAGVSGASPPSGAGAESEETMCESRQRVCLVLAGEFFVCLILLFFFSLES